MNQLMGLSPEAIAFLKENKVPSLQCPHCKRDLIPSKLEKIGVFGNKHPLYRHLLKDGKYADEFVQKLVSNINGCHFFLGLRVIDIVFKWSFRN